MEIIYKKVQELIPYINNSRTHNDEQVNQICASINEFGFTNPLLIDEKGSIIAGHGRLMASKKLGMEEVPCIVLERLTEAQKKAYIIADNKMALNAGWDEELLKIELENLKELDFDLELTGFNVDELDDILGKNEEEVEIVEDNFEIEVPQEPKAKLGDIYQLGNHRLMCGDSTNIDDVEKLMNGNKADMVFTDPPYNIDFKDDKGRNIKNDNLGLEFKNFINSVVKNCLKNINKGYMYMCFSQRFITEYLKCIIENNIQDYDLIIWEKDTAMRLGKDYKNYYEPIWLFRINEPDFYGQREYEKNVWHINSIHSANSKDDFGNSWFKGGNKNLTLHPTQKPVEVSAKAIKNSSKEKETVLDLFGGSGSTLIASEQLNRNCYMMELDPKYVDVIINRWEQFTGEKAVKIN